MNKMNDDESENSFWRSINTDAINFVYNNLHFYIANA